MSKAPSSQQMVVGEAWAIDTRVRQMSAGRWSLDSPVVAQEGKGGGTKPSEITALLASIDFSPLTKIHQAAVLTHRFCSSMVAGRGTNTLKDPQGNNLRCGVQTLCYGGVPRSSTGGPTAVRS
uniref:Uncharacterized protein n=1 Tax=Eutreptiella gymnastica TaxID=73025 RepID=A0A7S4D3S7_9EUGL